MAELTNLESKLGEVLGLAQGAQATIGKVLGLFEDDDPAEVRTTLERMRDEAAETERRCTEVAGTFDGKKTAILEQASETKGEATEMADTYLGGDADGLDGLEFLTMTEAGEFGHWSIVETMSAAGENAELQRLSKWAVPIEQRHFQATLDGSLKLAAEEDPDEPA